MSSFSTHGLSGILDRVPDAIFAVDKNWAITFVNATAAALVGKSPSDLIGTIIWDSYPELRRTRFENSIRRAVFHGATATVEDFLEVYGMWVEVQAFPSNGEVTIYLRDRTERRQAEEMSQFQNALLNGVERAIIATDAAGVIRFWNRFATKLYGWTPSETLGRHVLEVMTNEATREQGDEILAAVSSGKRWSGQFQSRRKDGSSFLAHVTDQPIFDDAGKLIGVVGSSVDAALADAGDLGERPLS